MHGGMRIHVFFSGTYIHTLSKLIDLVFGLKLKQSRNSKFLKVVRHDKKDDTRCWVKDAQNDSKKAKFFTQVKLKRWFNFLVDNIYLQFSKDKILRQRIGIPMGTNCAVYVANLFCFTYEYDFISRVIAKNRLDIISRFRLTLRFVDDLLTCDNNLFGDYTYLSQTDNTGLRGIYPSY